MATRQMQLSDKKKHFALILPVFFVSPPTHEFICGTKEKSFKSFVSFPLHIPVNSSSWIPSYLEIKIIRPSLVDFLFNETIIQADEQQQDDFVNGIRLSTKPILRFRPPAASTTRSPATVYRFNKTTLAPSVMKTSKIWQQLSFRLPRDIRPRKYQLRLQPDLKNKTFSGNITIRLEVLKPISYIPLHAKLLTVETKNVEKLDEELKPLRTITPSLTFEHPQLEYWVTEFAEPLEVGNYSIQLSFNGSLVDRIVGFYQSSYLDKERKEKRYKEGEE